MATQSLLFNQLTQVNQPILVSKPANQRIQANRRILVSLLSSRRTQLQTWLATGMMRRWTH